MSTGGDGGHKGPAVSAQEAQMQAIMQQARVKDTLIHIISHTHGSVCKLIALFYYYKAGDEGSNWTDGFDRPSRSSGMSAYCICIIFCQNEKICDFVSCLI